MSGVRPSHPAPYYASVVKLVDTTDLKSVGVSYAGSSPARGTILNKSMKLFTNGCSFTWGGEIYATLGYKSNEVIPTSLTPDHYKFREEHIWSFHLHKLINSENIFNLSSPGAANNRIVRTTLEFFIDYLERGLPVDEIIAVIQWTDLHRYEIYDSLTKQYVNVYSYDFSTFPKLEENIATKYKLRLLDHEINSVNKFIQDVTCLSSFFDKHKIKYVFGTMNKISLPNTYIKSLNWLGTDEISNCILEENKFRFPGKHPNLHGHKIIAEKLYKRLVELYNI